MKRLLVPTDFSAEALKGLQTAVQIAKKLDAEIFLLHVFTQEIIFYADYISINELENMTEADMQDTQKVNMTRLLKEQRLQLSLLKRQYSQVKISPFVAFNDMQQQLNNFVKEQKIDLLVMGSKGLENDDRLFAGSNAQKIIRTARCPVLTVKHYNPEATFRNICFASDFRQAPNAFITTLKAWQQAFGSTLHLLKVITPSNFEISSQTLDTMESFARAYQLQHYALHSFNAFVEYEGIIEFADRNQIDLIVMLTQGNTGIMHVLMGSIAEDVANMAKHPLLTFNLSYL